MRAPLPILRLPANELRPDPTAAGALSHFLILLLLFIVGAAGLLCESPDWLNLDRTFALHGLFALLLAASVAAQCYRGQRLLADRSNMLRNELARRSSRSIYLLLYCLVATQLLIDIAQVAAGRPMRLNTNHCSVYVECGVVAQLLLRTLSSTVVARLHGYCLSSYKALVCYAKRDLPP